MQYTQYDLSDGVAWITLNRPEKRNALNEQFVGELKELFRKSEQDTNCKIIMLKAEGKAFCAGADLAYLQKLQKFTREENEADSRHLMELYQMIHLSEKVVIAQIEGHALAGGCGLATVADYSFSVPEAKFGYTEVKIGFIPAIVMVFLIRKIGEGKARDILLSGEVFTAQKAQELGMINKVIAEGEIKQEVKQFAERLISSNSSQSMGLVKRMIHQIQDMSLEGALEHAVKMNAIARETDDCKHGIASFLNKEKITWK